jgi:hypothetical protein
MKFSDRIGITKPKSFIQIDSMDDELINSLWNLFAEEIGIVYERNWHKWLVQYSIYFFKTPIEEVNPDSYNCRKFFYEWFKIKPWFEIYNFLEFFAQKYNILWCIIYPPDPSLGDYRLIEYKEAINNNKTKFIENLNNILTREISGFRFIVNNFVPISDKNEIDSITGALVTTNNDKLFGIRKHFESALDLLAKKPEPDYRNSVKESISAVEGICKIFVGKKSGGISDAIRFLSDKNIYIHSALKEGIVKIYGYTSDEHGIRHPILENNKNVGLAEAKFMLVICSAFVNFIVLKSKDLSIIK